VDKKRLLLMIFTVFAAIYYLARIAIFSLGLSGEMDFEAEQSALVEAVVIYSFLAIGILGLVFLPGVYMHRPWGLWGTLAISAYTVVFDLWAFALVQSSAIAGIVPAAAIAGYVLLTRKEYTAGG